LYFATSRGVAVLDPGMRKAPMIAPMAHVVEMTANNERLDLRAAAQLAPGKQRLEIRYTGIHLSAPDRVQYSYRLDGLDVRWVGAGTRRVIDYNSLPHGHYRFHVKAELPGAVSEQSYAFEVLPQFWETMWFRGLAALVLAMCAWAAYQVRLRQIRSRFTAVLEERGRLAREIHDTLAQGLTGIVVQLGAAQRALAASSDDTTQHIDLAQQMARESLAEARRSVWNLRAPALERGDLSDALRGLVSRSSRPETEASFEQRGEPWPLPPGVESALLRVCQEALANVAKHAGATHATVALEYTPDAVHLSINDDGAGFADLALPQGVATPGPWGGFGLLGMRERLAALGGSLELSNNGGAHVVAVVPREDKETRR